MIRFIKNSGWAFYLGFMMGILGYNFTTWQFWVTLVPTSLLVIWTRDEAKQNN